MSGPKSPALSSPQTLLGSKLTATGDGVQPASPGGLRCPGVRQSIPRRTGPLPIPVPCSAHLASRTLPPPTITQNKQNQTLLPQLVPTVARCPPRHAGWLPLPHSNLRRQIFCSRGWRAGRERLHLPGVQGKEREGPLGGEAGGRAVPSPVLGASQPPTSPNPSCKEGVVIPTLSKPRPREGK